MVAVGVASLGMASVVVAARTAMEDVTTAEPVGAGGEKRGQGDRCHG